MALRVFENAVLSSARRTFCIHDSETGYMAYVRLGAFGGMVRVHSEGWKFHPQNALRSCGQLVVQIARI